MNSSAARACRADRRFANVAVKIPRDFKRQWKSLSSKEKGRLRAQWRLSQTLVRMEGEKRHKAHLDALKAFVKPGELKL